MDGIGRQPEGVGFGTYRHYMPVRSGCPVGPDRLGAVNPLTLLKAAPWLLCAILGAALLWYRGSYESEKAGRVADALAAEQAADKKINDAKALSDADIAALNTKMAALSTTTTVYVDRIQKVPVTMACAQSPAMKDASEAVRALVTGK